MAHKPRIVEVFSDEEEDEYELRTEQKEEDYSSGDDIFAVCDFTFAVERPEKQITAKRKQVLDGVYPPRLRDVTGKENKPPRDEETGRTLRGNRGAAAQQQKPSEGTQLMQKSTVGKEKESSEPIPVEVHEPRFDASKDSDIIQDQSRKKRPESK